MKLEVVLTSDVARILRVTPETVRAMNRRGELHATRTEGGVRLFDRAEVERVANERAARARRAVAGTTEAA